MTEYKEIEMKEALMRYADGERVYYRYFTNGGYRWIGSLGLDHLRRNPERYTFYIEEPKKTLWDKGIINTTYGNCFSEEDVKEALKEFMLWVDTWTNDTLATKSDRYKTAKKLFGKEMLE